MALSDCDHCWDTPCTCGWEFKDKKAKEMAILFCYWPKARVEKLIQLLQDTLPLKSVSAVHDSKVKE